MWRNENIEYAFMMLDSRCKGFCIMSYFIGCQQDVEIAKDYDKKIVSYVP